MNLFSFLNSRQELSEVQENLRNSWLILNIYLIQRSTLGRNEINLEKYPVQEKNSLTMATIQTIRSKTTKSAKRSKRRREQKKVLEELRKIVPYVNKHTPLLELLQKVIDYIAELQLSHEQVDFETNRCNIEQKSKFRKTAFDALQIRAPQQFFDGCRRRQGKYITVEDK
ncbi:unnamed protein product [Onchocerca flexuosa]|uniref:BHLH domain-containing protein n=1 Tax=Onchocerca flexuosa TaxID=387005 RepID=A0A183HYU2_9BILA|nr:unnamed protein product [Onchocerca flexuosa]